MYKQVQRYQSDVLIGSMENTRQLTAVRARLTIRPKRGLESRVNIGNRLHKIKTTLCKEEIDQYGLVEFACNGGSSESFLHAKKFKEISGKCCGPIESEEIVWVMVGLPKNEVRSLMVDMDWKMGVLKC